MRKNFEEFDLHKAQQLAQSEAGQQLFALLQGSHKSQMEAAAASARAGNMEEAKKALVAFMADPQAQALLKKIQEKANG